MWIEIMKGSKGHENIKIQEIQGERRDGRAFVRLRGEAFRIAREEGSATDVLEVEVEHDDPLETCTCVRYVTYMVSGETELDRPPTKGRRKDDKEGRNTYQILHQRAEEHQVRKHPRLHRLSVSHTERSTNNGHSQSLRSSGFIPISLIRSLNNGASWTR